MTMPQKFQTERRYVNTFLKLLYYNHALRRFDKSKSERTKTTLLILWARRGTAVVHDGQRGWHERLQRCVDVIREAGASNGAVAAAQHDLVAPPLGNDSAKALTLNLRNRMIFRAADEATLSKPPISGKKRVVKRSWGYSAGKQNTNYSETEEHKIKPHKLRNLHDHECVLVHCERGFRRVTCHPWSRTGQ